MDGGNSVSVHNLRKKSREIPDFPNAASEIRVRKHILRGKSSEKPFGHGLSEAHNLRKKSREIFKTENLKTESRFRFADPHRSIRSRARGHPCTRRPRFRLVPHPAVSHTAPSAQISAKTRETAVITTVSAVFRFLLPTVMFTARLSPKAERGELLRSVQRPSV